MEDAKQLQNIEMVAIIDAEEETGRDLQLLTIRERSEQIPFRLQQSNEPYP